MTLTVVTVIFGVFAVGLIILLIYKSTLTMHEDDQLFLDDHNSHMQDEQTELLVKVNRLTIPVNGDRFGDTPFSMMSPHSRRLQCAEAANTRGAKITTRLPNSYSPFIPCVSGDR